MSRDDILEGVRTVLREHLDITRPIDATTDIVAELELDSIMQLTLVVELENHFRVCFEPGDEQNVTTVGDVVQLIQVQLIQGALP